MLNLRVGRSFDFGQGRRLMVDLDVFNLPNSGRFQVLDEFGVYWSWLGTNWPADTYTFTLTASGAPTITKTVTKVP